jgi:hypothetical protein
MMAMWMRWTLPFLGKSLIFAGLFSVLGMQAVWADLPRQSDRHQETREIERLGDKETGKLEIRLLIYWLKELPGLLECRLIKQLEV